MPQATTVIDTSDAEEECRSAVQVVQAALRDDDGSPTASERIAILYPSATPYARTLRAELDAAGIAWNGQRVDPVVESMLGRWVLALLRLDQRGWRRADVLRLLAEAPMLHQTSDGPRRVPVGAWERMTREAGITAGAATWQTALATVIVGHETSAEAERREVEPRTWLVDRHLRHAADATALQDFVTALIDGHQQHLGDATTWTQLAEGLRHLLTTQLDRDWDRWPPEARAAAERVELAIRRLTVLDDAPSATAPTPAMAAQIMEGELTDDLGRHGTFGHGVLVGPLSLGVGLDLDVVVVIGMAEGVTPAPTADDPLLHDDERAVLDGALPLRRDRSAQQHRQVIAALASGQRERVVIWSRGDLRRSAQREPSRWLAAFDARGAEHVASFAQRIAQTPIPATPATYRLAALRRGDPDLLDQHPVVADDQVLQRAVAAVTARRGPAFTRFDGNLTHAAHLIRRLDEASTSASRLETWAGCPHQYLVRYVLRVEPLEVPEARLDISALDKGSLIHDVLEAWIQEQLDADAVPDPDQPWNAVQRQRLLQLAADAGEQYVARGLTGHPTLWAYTRDRTLRDLARLLDEDDAHRQATGTRPVAVELAFGGEGEHVPPPIVLADGTALRLRGRIDRVDRDAAGVLQVVDYKTGSAMRANELDDPVRAGRSLQLSLYARALAGWEGSDGQELRATYWYISAKGGFARVGVVVDDAVIARQEEVLDTIVGGIHGGIFVANPDRSTTPWVTCAYCDPDGLGTAELGARFERLGRTAPELHAYVGMVEPDLLGPGQALDEGSTS
jgi:ATP-dependent helicase/nuclease subunit B